MPRGGRKQSQSAKVQEATSQAGDSGDDSANLNDTASTTPPKRGRASPRKAAKHARRGVRGRSKQVEPVEEPVLATPRGRSMSRSPSKARSRSRSVSFNNYQSSAQFAEGSNVVEVEVDAHEFPSEEEVTSSD